MEEGIHGEWNLPEEKNIMIEMQSDPICSSAGCTQYKHDEQKPGYPMDYFVPNFGVDHEILASHDGLKWAEKERGYNWVWKKEDKPDSDVYKVPDFGVDHDIIGVQDGL